MISNDYNIGANERIILAAKSEFAERGFDGARMGSIAKSAGVNQALIHYYFGSKEKLYIEILERTLNIGQMDDIPIFDNDELTSSQKLLIAIYFLVCLHHESVDNDYNLILSRDFIEGRESLKPLISKYMIPRHEMIADLINKGIEEGEFEAANPIFVVLQLFTFVIFYGISRKTYMGTSWEKKLYLDVTKDDLVKFITESIFKTLLPAGKTLNIPEVPAYLFKLIDNVIETIKTDIKGGMKNE